MTGKQVGETVGDMKVGMVVGVAGGGKGGVAEAVIVLVGRGMNDLWKTKYLYGSNFNKMLVNLSSSHICGERGRGEKRGVAAILVGQGMRDMWE